MFGDPFLCSSSSTVISWEALIKRGEKWWGAETQNSGARFWGPNWLQRLVEHQVQSVSLKPHKAKFHLNSSLSLQLAI